MYTTKQINVTVWIFIVLLVAAFAAAVWGVLGMLGVHG